MNSPHNYLPRDINSFGIIHSEHNKLELTPKGLRIHFNRRPYLIREQNSLKYFLVGKRRIYVTY